MSIASVVGKVFSGISRAFALARVTLANLLVVLVVVLVVMLFVSGTGRVEVSAGSALLLETDGTIVEQAGGQDPLALLTGASLLETPLKDILSVLDKAQKDDRVDALVLDTSSLGYVAPAQLEVIGNALEAFRSGGKTVLAKSDFYNRDQYYLASFADEVVMHPLGEVALTGYGTYRNYYGGLLDKLKVNIHVFRVGTYKSFVEPYTSTGMSEAARQANRAMIDRLWSSFVERVATNRGLKPEKVVAYANHYDELLRETGGDTARLARQYGLVDELLDPEALSKRLNELTDGKDAFAHVTLGDYVDPDLPALFGTTVAVVPLTGTIVMGDAPRGFIGADTASRLLAGLRDDSQVGAVVLPNRLRRGQCLRFRTDSRRDRPDTGRGHASGGLHGRYCGIGRLLDRGHRGRDLGRANHGDRIDWHFRHCPDVRGHPGRDRGHPRRRRHRPVRRGA